MSAALRKGQHLLGGRCAAHGALRERDDKGRQICDQHHGQEQDRQTPDEVHRESVAQCLAAATDPGSSEKDEEHVAHGLRHPPVKTDPWSLPRPQPEQVEPPLTAGAGIPDHGGVIASVTSHADHDGRQGGGGGLEMRPVQVPERAVTSTDDSYIAGSRSASPRASTGVQGRCWRYCWRVKADRSVW
jgi:hypothetical protein